MRKALLIGIDNYGTQSLSGCVNDMNAVAELLRSHEDGTPNFDVMTEANCASSRRALGLIHELFSSNDEIALLYFSGHGYINENGGQLVFPDDIENRGAYVGIKMSDILNIANNSPAKNKMIVLDCCHSGNMGYMINDKLSAISNGVSILTACLDSEPAMEVNGHGMFTEQLCNALVGGAADFSGNITIGGVYAFIDRTFGAWQQRPTFKTNVTEFVPIRKTIPQVKPEIMRKLVDLFDSENSELKLDPSFEDTNTHEKEHEVIEPYANPDNVHKFKILQQLEGIGMVEPVGETHMYFAAMNSKSCKLTRLGQYYWRLVNSNKI